jgi:hypothetical protein
MYLGPVLESKWLVMQTIGYHLRLFWTQTLGGNLRKDVSGCYLASWTFILLSFYIVLSVLQL